jgi:ABC-type Fe3+/spermidine/putrescine transport system ATPase subunit
LLSSAADENRRSKAGSDGSRLSQRGTIVAEFPVLRLEGLAKFFVDRAALDNVSFSVNKGEYVSLLGPSGSGKTVLLRSIAGFETPNKGRVILRGEDVTNKPPYQRGVGFVFQNFALFPHLSVFDNVAFGLRNGAHRIRESKVRAPTLDMLELVGLKGFEGRGVNQISGGQKQRVALARTLVLRPEIVLLDEPLGALDANLRLRMRGELRRIREQLAIPFLHVTGSETEALAMGDRLIVLDRGRVSQFGKPSDVYDRPANPNVARLLNCYNVFEGAIQGDSFVTSYGKFPLGPRVTSSQSAYAVRYDQILTRPGGGWAGLSASYVASEYLGSAIVHFFEALDGKIIEVEHHLSNGPPDSYAPGQTYRLSWNVEDGIAFG